MTGPTHSAEINMTSRNSQSYGVKATNGTLYAGEKFYAMITSYTMQEKYDKDMWTQMKFRVDQLFLKLAATYEMGKIPHRNFVQAFAKEATTKRSKFLRTLVSLFNKKEKYMTLQELVEKIIEALCSPLSAFRTQHQKYLSDPDARWGMALAIGDACASAIVPVKIPQPHRLSKLIEKYFGQPVDLIKSFFPGRLTITVLKIILPIAVIVFGAMTAAAQFSPLAFKATVRLFASTASTGWWAMKFIATTSKKAFGLSTRKGSSSLVTVGVSSGSHQGSSSSSSRTDLIGRLLGSANDPAPTDRFDPSRPCGADSHLNSKGYDRAKIMAVAARMGIGTSRKKTTTQLCEEVREKYFELVAAAEAKTVKDDMVLKVEVANAKNNDDDAS